MTEMMRDAGRWSGTFARGDLDGFFGLFIDNLLLILLIVVLGPSVCGFTAELIETRILPGVAVSVVFGNLFYAWQARRLAMASGRDDVTALPYGINAVSLLAFIFLVMGPVYRATGDALLAWQVGLFACLLNAVMELLGAFLVDGLRRHTPRAALLSALAGIALTFIAMGFVFRVFAAPALALLPMLLLLAVYGGQLRLPWNIPGGLFALGVGVVLGWSLRGLGVIEPAPAALPVSLGGYLPRSSLPEMLALIDSPLGWGHLSVILPMGLLNIIGSLQNLESAEAAGDRYETRPSLLANGIGSLVAAAFGSAFPTTIYIGHPAWKRMGARAGYSILNAAVIAPLCLTGAYTLVLKWLPIEATLGILVWVGLIITAQAFQDTPRRHALAVAIGMVPALAAWALLLLETTLRAAGSTLLSTLPRFGDDLPVRGLIALSQGFVFSSMLLAAMLASLIDRRFDRAAVWATAAALLSFTGLIHAYRLTEEGVQNAFGLNVAPPFTAVYLASAGLFWVAHLWSRRTAGSTRDQG